MTRACSGPMQAARVAAAPHAIREPEHALRVRDPQQQQRRHQRQRPDGVVDEGLAALPEREERIPPAVLQQQAGQHQAERQEGAAGRAAEQQAATSAHAPVIRPATRAVPVHCATARRQVATSVPLNLTSSGSVARPRERVERERVGHVGEAERAELRGAQLAGDVEAHGRVAHAAHRLVRQAPAEPLGHPARQPPRSWL